MGLARNAEELRQSGMKLIEGGYHCIDCGNQFKLGQKGDPGVNVYTDAGVRELPITQVCESCYDDMFQE